MELPFAKRLGSRVTLASTRATGHRTLPRMRGWCLFLPIAVVLLVAGGCASVPAPPPSEEVRASLGRIGILSGSTSPAGEWDMPAKGGAAGAGRGAALGASVFLHGGCVGVGCGVALLLVPIGAAVGAVSGAAAAEPATVVEEAEATIQSAFTSLKIQDVLRDRIVQVAQAETRQVLVPQDDAVGACATGESSARCAAVMDTIVQINVQGYGTKAVWSPNPPVFLFLDVQLRLLRAADSSDLYSRKATWVSAGRPLAEWADSNGDPVREELGRGIQYLAERIVDVVFLLRSAP